MVVRMMIRIEDCHDNYHPRILCITNAASHETMMIEDDESDRDAHHDDDDKASAGSEQAPRGETTQLWQLEVLTMITTGVGKHENKCERTCNFL